MVLEAGDSDSPVLSLPPPPTPFFKTLVQKTTLSLWMELAFFSALSML